MEGYRTGFARPVTNKAGAASSRHYLSRFKLSCLFHEMDCEREAPVTGAISE